MHPKEYERYVELRDKEKFVRNEYQSQLKSQPQTEQSQTGQPQSQTPIQPMAKFEQTDFDRIVTDFMINGMHAPTLLEDPSFDMLLNGKEP